MQRFTYYAKSQCEGQEQAIVNWRENDINDSLFYSYRSTRYRRDQFPSRLHCHDYYELIVFVEGEIEYVCESSALRPRAGDVILIPPRTMHMSRMLGDETLYQRHVFYLYEDAFSPYGCEALSALLREAEQGELLTLQDREALVQLLALLEKYDKTLEAAETPIRRALAVSYLLQIFCLLNEAKPTDGAKNEYASQGLLRVRAYLDEHFAEIENVAQVSEQFFYSREYLSRLFKKHYNTTVAEYLRQRRIACAQAMLANGVPITKACYQVGFGNMSAFIRAFRRATGTTPSDYQRRVRAK